MTKENLVDQTTPENPQLAELVSEAVRLAEKVESLGYEGLHLPLLLTGSIYRLNSLYYDEVHERQDQINKLLSQEEKQTIWEKMSQAYEVMSPINLFETFRYQYNRKQKEENLSGPEYPRVDSPNYQPLFALFEELAQLLEKIQTLFPEESIKDLLPYKVHGVWTT